MNIVTELQHLAYEIEMDLSAGGLGLFKPILQFAVCSIRRCRKRGWIHCKRCTSTGAKTGRRRRHSPLANMERTARAQGETSVAGYLSRGSCPLSFLHPRHPFMPRDIMSSSCAHQAFIWCTGAGCDRTASAKRVPTHRASPFLSGRKSVPCLQASTRNGQS